MHYIFYIFVFFLLTACSEKTILLKNDSNASILNDDLKYAQLEFEQNVSLLPTLSDTLKINPNTYKQYFFKAWHSGFKGLKKENLFWAFNLYQNPKNQYYFFNKQKIPASWFQQQIQNANIENFAKISKKAIITHNTLLKNFPTTKAILKDPFKENEGFPFDYANDSVLNAGSAVLISHYTHDKKFAFIMCESGFGFVESKNLEIFTDKRAKIYENLNFITPIKEKIPVLNENQEFIFETRIGAIYPYYKSDKNYFYGKIGKNKYKISKLYVQKFPLTFKDAELKNQIKEILNLPYGWGGYDFERDCSLFTRDIFSSFGFYLPRNSAAQKNFTHHFNIQNLNNTQKEEFIKHFAKPYLSLLYMKGHIMLYAGEIQNQNIVIHNIWGLKKDNTRRLLIGQSAITSLKIGEREIALSNLLLSRLEEITIFNLNNQEITNINAYLKNLTP